jgi:hypothetical protein
MRNLEISVIASTSSKSHVEVVIEDICLADRRNKPLLIIDLSIDESSKIKKIFRSNFPILHHVTAKLNMIVTFKYHKYHFSLYSYCKEIISA